MLGLTFLSNDNKKLLQSHEDRLSRATTPQLRNEAQLAIQEIMAKAKPYIECDLLEADELKSQLLQKINILSGLGKMGSAEVFRMHLKDVDFHIQTLQMREVIQERNKMQPPDEPAMTDKAPTITSMKKEKRRKEAFGQPRWLVGFEDEPDGENK